MPASEPRRPAAQTEGPVLFSEDGWSWAWIFAAPAFCVSAALFEVVTGAPVHWLMLTVCAIASALCHGVMIAATRVHGRVRLTPTTYTQGTEDLGLDRILEVLPLPDNDQPEASWETARTLGELHDAPRRRGSVGLRLDSGGEVRAWTRDPVALHAALTDAVGAVSAAGTGDTGSTGSAGSPGEAGGTGSTDGTAPDPA